MNHTSYARRKFLFTMLGLACGAGLPLRRLLADEAPGFCWDSFVLKMRDLADEYDAGQVSSEQVAAQGVRFMKSLDIDGKPFADALEAAYESGNEYWLWQRMLKKSNVNGGVLTIDRNQLVRLHDHPGATGMMRIISGEAEVWQYDRVNTSADGSTAELQLVSRKIVRPGDTSVLTPVKGNIHALRSVSADCRILDFFIPPYQQNQRTWFEPLNSQWQEMQRIRCRCIPQYEIAKA